MKTETAVEWLMEQIAIEKDGKMMLYYYTATDVTHIFEQAKKMEKNQIIDAYNQGEFCNLNLIDAEEYFNDTLNKT